MRSPENEPQQNDIEKLVTDEERRVLDDPGIPDEVKSEVSERLRSFRDADLEQLQAEDARKRL